MSIISIRGTSGSGKTHLARAIWKLYDTATPHMKEKRKQPYYYELTKKGKKRPLYILGGYETACGGCDTIKTADEVYALIRELSQTGDVLFEGLLLSTEVNRFLTLPSVSSYAVFINLPVEKCLEQVNARRRAKDPSKEDVNPANTISKHRGVVLTERRLIAAGRNVVRGDYNGCYNKIKQILGL